jgi:predicted nucleic acid-binding protein
MQILTTPKVISNSSCLIALDNINMLFILKEKYGKIIIREEVLYEFQKPIENWIEVKPVQNRNYLKVLSNIVDLGEASTIALSLELPEHLMILDDLKARKLAHNMKLPFTGLLGVIAKSKQMGIISSAEEVLSKLKSVNFRISPAMHEETLQLAGENL